jgi:hypothetical protein
LYYDSPENTYNQMKIGIDGVDTSENSYAYNILMPVANELSKKLNRICKGLAFLFGPVVNGRREFIISADGNKKLFPNVKKLVQDAPDIPGWRIIAFRPPVQDISGFKLSLGNMELGANDVWFTARKTGILFELNVFVRVPPGANKDAIGQATFLLLDHAIGEYNMETRIGRMEFQQLPADPVAAGLKPLSELSQIIC